MKYYKNVLASHDLFNINICIGENGVIIFIIKRVRARVKNIIFNNKI